MRLLHRGLLFIIGKVNLLRPGIKLYWWREKATGVGNFGDEVTPIIIERLWGRRCHWTRLADCEMVGAGSILDLVHGHNPIGHKLQVWGSGLIEAGDQLVNPDIAYSLVRGPFTAARLGIEGQVPYGDPGLLASKVFPPAESVKYKVGILPHMRDLNDEGVKRLAEQDGYLLISPYQPPEKVAKDITSCGLILSSSLHGLIFSDSYGVPNFQLKQNELEGSDYKFDDYYRSTNRDRVCFSVGSLLDDGATVDIEVLKRQFIPVGNIEELQDIIVTAFPLKKSK